MVDNYFNILYKTAICAKKENEVPISALIVKDGRILCCEYNTKESDMCVLSHAEIKCIYSCSKKIKNWRLEDCDIYVLLEPCNMCAASIKQARIRNVYYFLKNSDSNIEVINDLIYTADKVNKSVNYYFLPGYEKKVEHLLSDFFKSKR